MMADYEPETLTIKHLSKIDVERRWNYAGNDWKNCPVFTCIKRGRKVTRSRRLIGSGMFDSVHRWLPFCAVNSSFYFLDYISTCGSADMFFIKKLLIHLRLCPALYHMNTKWHHRMTFRHESWFWKIYSREVAYSERRLGVFQLVHPIVKMSKSPKTVRKLQQCISTAAGQTIVSWKSQPLD